MKKIKLMVTNLFLGLLLNTNAQSIDQLKVDWPNLNRFRNENTKLLANGIPKNAVVFIGNSITEGWINMHPDFFKKNNYINRGIGGQTTPQILLRFKQDVVALHPKTVVILAGTNDIAGNTGPSTLEMIEDNLSSMAEIAKENNIKVVLCSVLPVYDYPWKSGLEPAQKIINLNKWIKEYANKNGHIYCDYFTPMADEKNGLKTNLGNDGVHPNLDGYNMMEPIIQKAIKESFTK